MQLMPKPMTNRERDRHIQEAEDGITTCEAAFEKSPDQPGRDVYGWPLLMWRRGLADLNPPWATNCRCPPNGDALVRDNLV
jgi:hypothetical protein